MFRRLISMVFLSFVVGAAAPAVAQDQSPPLVEIVTVEINPGSEALFEEFIMGLRTAASQSGSNNYWLVSQSVSGPPVYRFHLQHGTWATYGEPDPAVVDALGERETTRIYDLARQSVKSVSRAFYRPLENISVTRAEMERPPDAVTYNFMELNPGTAGIYVETAALTAEASGTLYPDAAYTINAPGIGADGFLVIGVVEHWSDMDTPLPNPGQRVIEHFGQERGAEIIARVGESIVGFTTVLARTRPDLNYQPE